jgi:hypothetical protein
MLDPIKKAAVYAMSLADNADDVARVADDWGWKGGKPGEVTGTDYMNDMSIRSSSLVPVLRKNFSDVGHPDDADLLMQWFADMEKAGIPRRWTGKLAKKLWNTPAGQAVPYDESPSGMATYFQNVSNVMGRLTEKERADLLDNYLTLLPEWTESAEDFANFVRNV